MATLVRRSLALLRAPANALGYLARSQLRWSRGIVELPEEPKDDLFCWLDAIVRAQAEELERSLRRQFDLRMLSQQSTRLGYAENLALLEAAERMLGHVALPVGPDGVLRAVDVGAGVFQYATALQRFLAHGGTSASRRVVLRAIEVDGHGIYRDGHSRNDHARAHAALAGDEVRFEVADFTALRLPEQDVVTMLFPFVERYALLQWGLPLGLFRPRQLFARAVATVRPGGLLVVANQTEAEFAQVQALLADQPVALVRRVSLATQLVPYAEQTQERVGSVWQRQEHHDAPHG